MTTPFRISLAAARVNAELTQAELGARLGVAKTTVINWENGKSEPSMSQLRTISDLSKIPMDYIFVPEQSN